ncbi:MAG: aminotransferase class V-fold PLP-dependent enzyme [Bacteroidota bacterium]
MDKRTFLKQMALIGVGSTPLFKQLDQIVSAVAHRTPDEVATDEAFWAEVRAGYRLKPDYINLENGYYCMAPQETLEHFIHHVREMNYQASYYMRTVQWSNKKRIHEKLAKMVGASAEEIVVTRNTTESLDTVIAGYPWKEGDEALMANQDYGAMLNMFRQVGERHGVKINRIDVPMDPKTDEEVVAAYEKALTPNTRLLMICHLINITGHVLPVRKICDMAHAKGVEVMVDGAHAIAHLQFTLPELGCDYYGSSLHKWLSTPVGAGLLYVKKEHIPKIWPMFAEWGKEPDDILRLNHTGTHPCHTDLAIGNAIEYFYRLGPARKEARLRYLQRYWSDQVRDLPHIRLNTPRDPQRSCAIANVGIKGMEPSEMARRLLHDYGIWTVAINNAGVKGCRITPNVFTTTEELDTFVAALKDMAT